MSRWNLFVWLLAPGAVIVATVAAYLAWNRSRRWFAVAGMAGAALGIYVVVQSWSPNTESFEDLALVLAWMFFVAPLACLAVIGAILPRPGTPTPSVPPREPSLNG